MFLCLLSLSTLALVLQGCVSAPQEDLITDLPGLTFTPNFTQYSGYLQGDTNMHLHYWFVESTSNSSTAPLVLWLANGGPVVSALFGLLIENGPFKVNADGKTLSANPNSWNQIANIIYLETPANIGFSYCDIEFNRTGDKETAKNNFLAVKDFFKKFPEYSKNDLYLAGEDYASFHAALLSSFILDDSDIKLKGLVIGNGEFDWDIAFSSIYYYDYFHGFSHKSDFDKALQACCPDENPLRCNFNGNSTAKPCFEALRNLGLPGYEAKLNAFNVMDDDHIGYDEFSSRSVLKSELFQSKSRRISALPAPLTTYMNMPETKKALHISDKAPHWYVEGRVYYNPDYDTVKPQMLKALKKKLRMLLYAGDLDELMTFLGVEWFVESLNDSNPKDYGPWFYSKDFYKIDGGFFKAYDHITFATVRGAGQLVGYDKPEAALTMFTMFMRDQPFGKEI